MIKSSSRAAQQSTGQLVAGSRARRYACALATAALVAVSVAGAGAADASTASAVPSLASAGQNSGCAGRVDAAGRHGCPQPRAVAVAFSDALNKATVDGVAVGGLSGLTVDRRSGGFVAIEDHSLNDPARVYFIKNSSEPVVTGVLTLHKADGTPFDANNFDGEGIAVLPNGNFLVSSEVEPSIRIFDRTGTEVGSLEVPARFQVAPKGEAKDNATLEGLSISPSGEFIYATMEGTLSGDLPSAGEGRHRRILMYHSDHHGGYRLTKQIGYDVDAGNRISEVTAYADGKLLVLEIQFVPGKGNVEVKIYAVAGADSALDISGVANLSTAPAADIVPKKLLADLVAGPTLGAPSSQPQVNPLMDNYEAMSIARKGHSRMATVTLISDDNFNATQVTRMLTLAAVLP
jgi:hypothetical protein